jgi:hypothetical protein
MARITVIQLSLRGFVCGLVGVLPFIGVVPAVYALSCWARIQLRYRHEWNPAANYLGYGALLSVLGLGLTAISIPAVIMTAAIYGVPSGQ